MISVLAVRCAALRDLSPWAECHLEREKRHSSAGKGGGEPLFNKELTLSLKKLNNLQSLYSDSGLLISLSVCSGSDVFHHIPRSTSCHQANTLSFFCFQ